MKSLATEKKGNIITILKKGKKDDPRNYLPISLRNPKDIQQGSMNLPLTADYMWLLPHSVKNSIHLKISYPTLSQ